MSDSLIGINCGNSDFAQVQHTHSILENAQASVRISKSVVMDFAYVASGKLDAVVGLASSHSQIIPALLLIKEAGGVVRDIYTKDVRVENLPELLSSGNILAVNPNLSTPLHGALNK